MEKISRVAELNDADAPIREILGKAPKWLVKWGNTLIMLFFVSLLAISILIKYPESVYTVATLSSVNAPKAVVVQEPGKLIKLFAKEGDLAKKGDVLGYMESIASYEEIMDLTKNIDTLQYLVKQNHIEQLLPYINTNYQNLGELQQHYQTFSQSFIAFRNYIQGGFFLRKKAMLNKDLAFLQKLHSNLVLQRNLSTQDLALSQQTIEASETLKNEKVISDFDYRNEKSRLINKKLALPQAYSAIISNESQQNEKQKEIIELENTIAQQKNIFLQALNTLKSQLQDWEKKYMLIAPIDGKVAFATFLQEKQELRANQVICFINPENSQYYAEIRIPQANLGKIKTGQEVMLKFPSYPYQEFGSVKGKIDFISNIAADSGYLARVILTNGLQTNYKKAIQFREGLFAQGEIITDDLRLIERFYYNVVKRINK